MIRPVFAVTLLALLAACGADGAPTRPATTEPKPAISLSGEARMGMVYSQ